MRTTVTLDDDVAAIAAQYAESRGLSRNKAIAELIVRSTRRSARIKHVGGLPVFDLPKSKQPITVEQVKTLEAVQTDVPTLSPKTGREGWGTPKYREVLCYSERAGHPPGRSSRKVSYTGGVQTTMTSPDNRPQLLLPVVDPRFKIRPRG